MSRTQINSPLAGAAPALQPTARPQSITIGATPPPARSPLMELGNAFHNFDGELRDMLRDASAREEKNAQAIGEITAAKAQAENRMGEINAMLKGEVDAGRLSNVHLPAAQRGASLRSGALTADVGYQTELLAGMADAVKGGPQATEKLISTLRTKYAEAIPASDFFARQGFDHTAAGIEASFRQRVANGQAQEFQRTHQEGLADVGTELAYHVATADSDAKPLALKALLDHAHTVWREVPTSDSTAFMVQRVVAPTIAKLVAEKKYPEALQLLDQAEQLDVTGKGGLLGLTGTGKTAFSQLRSHIEQQSRVSLHTDAEAISGANQLTTLKTQRAAGDALLQMQNANGGVLPLAERFKLIDTFNKTSTDSLASQVYAETVNVAYEHQERNRADPVLMGNLATQASSTLDPQKLDMISAASTAGVSNLSVTPQADASLQAHIANQRELAGLTDESDYRQLERTLFAAPDPVLQGRVTVNFGDDTKGGAQDQYNNLLSPTEQAEVRASVVGFFKTSLEQTILKDSGGNPATAKNAGFKAASVEKATQATTAFVKSAVAGKVQAQQAAKAEAEVAKQIVSIKTAAAIVGRPSEVPALAYTVMSSVQDAPDADPVPGDKPKEPRSVAFLKQYALPEVDARNMAKYEVKGRGESDIAVIRPPGQLAQQAIDLKALAKDALNTEEPAKAATARSNYGFLIQVTGLTPEEIKKSITRHGVPFDASAVDPHHVTLFRSLAELNTHWNNGEPDDVFNATGDAVGAGKLTQRDFYLAQRALLRGK